MKKVSSSSESSTWAEKRIKDKRLLTSCWWDTVLMRPNPDCRRSWWSCPNFRFRGHRNSRCESSHRISVEFRRFSYHPCRLCNRSIRSAPSCCASGGFGSVVAVGSSTMYATANRPMQLTLEGLNLYGHYGKVYWFYKLFFTGKSFRLRHKSILKTQ